MRNIRWWGRGDRDARPAWPGPPAPRPAVTLPDPLPGEHRRGALPILCPVQPIPSSAQVHDLAEYLRPADWRALDTAVIRRAGHHCEYCRRPDPELRTSGTYTYRDDRDGDSPAHGLRYQTLTALVALCPPCTDLVHWRPHGPAGLDEIGLTAYLSRVLNLHPEDAEGRVENQLADYRRIARWPEYPADLTLLLPTGATIDPRLIGHRVYHL